MVCALVSMGVVLLTSAPAVAAETGTVTAHVRTATCDRPDFRFRVENSTSRYRAFTVVLWNHAGDVVMKLKDKAPAWGGIRGVVKPDWRWHKFYAVEVFRTWNFKPDDHEWRLRTWLGGASALLDDC